MSAMIPAADFVRCVDSVKSCASTGARALPALNAIRVSWDYDEVTFAATDRYVAGVQSLPMPDADRVHGSAVIPLGTIKNVLAVIKATSPRRVEIDGEARTVLGFKFADPGEFPKIESLFPAGRADIGRILFDPAKLAQLAGPKIRGRYPALSCEFTGDTKLIVVTREGDDTFRGLLMPRRPASR